MTNPFPWRRTDATFDACGAKLLARTSPFYVLQSTSPASLDTEWRCSDPDCYHIYGSWIDG